MKLIDLFKSLWNKQLFHIFGIPFSFRIIFDPDALIAVLKKHNMSTEDVHKVRLVQGELDGILGAYDLRDGHVIIDAFEIAARTSPDPEELDRVVTQCLAHEIRHSWQKEAYGWFRVKWDQIAMLVLFTAVGWGILAYLLFRIGVVVFHGHLGLLALPVTIITLLAANFLFRLVFRLASRYSYRWCWCERDARAYAKKAVDDPDWGPVIRAQIGLTIPNL